ncbi:unnamed protein product, partial [Adineta ricciae]
MNRLNISDSNPSLLTAGLPSSSIMISQHVLPSSLNNHNQNHTTDTQLINSNFKSNIDKHDYTKLSHRTVSDTYLNLSRDDIDDIMSALHTLAQYLQYDVDSIDQQHMIPSDDNESHPLTMIFSKESHHSLKSSIQANSSFRHPPRYSLRKDRRRHSLSSDRWLHHREH